MKTSGNAAMDRGQMKPVQRTDVAGLRNPGLLYRLQPAQSTCSHYSSHLPVSVSADWKR